MSTDLHLHHQLPMLRIAAVKIDHVPSSPDRNVTSVVTQVENESDAAVTAPDDDESYHTPTSKNSKIPAMLTCPPAPRKRKAFVSCKRKLEFQFLEATNKEDMDAFFRSNFPKRSCPCT